MKNTGIGVLFVLFTLSMSACSFSKFTNMSGMEQMQTVASGAMEAKEKMDVYDNTKKVVKTADKVYDTVNSVSKGGQNIPTNTPE
ncbi:MAG: hypothetical protein OEZ01_15470 [Candidatus Heimdallarchaeota archaeon]|nr:hypothetical protein [Candidatus Heimdallarchaeota archaeon]